jgi:hypothetical protein
MSKATQQQIDDARALLKANGFFVDNLWSVDDVKHKYKCTDEEAQDCLEKSLTNDATMEQIWLSIDIFAEMENLKKRKNK